MGVDRRARARMIAPQESAPVLRERDDSTRLAVLRVSLLVQVVSDLAHGVQRLCMVRPLVSLLARREHLLQRRQLVLRLVDRGLLPGQLADGQALDLACKSESSSVCPCSSCTSRKTPCRTLTALAARGARGVRDRHSGSLEPRLFVLRDFLLIHRRRHRHLLARGLVDRPVLES